MSSSRNGKGNYGYPTNDVSDGLTPRVQTLLSRCFTLLWAVQCTPWCKLSHQIPLTSPGHLNVPTILRFWRPVSSFHSHFLSYFCLQDLPVLILLASFPSCGIFLVNLQVTISAKDWSYSINFSPRVCWMSSFLLNLLFCHIGSMCQIIVVVQKLCLVLIFSGQTKSVTH